MARTPDKPGTYRIKPVIGGGFRLSGVRTDGIRIKKNYAHEFEAQSAADGIWGKKVLDDWGLPVSDMRATPETIAGVNASLGITPTPAPQQAPTNDKDKANAKFAASLAEMVGMGWATGTVVFSKRITENLGKEPAKPSPKQVNDLAEAARDTIVGWFGDRNLKPWQVMMLLTFGIPMTMILQSPPKPKLASEQKTPDLKSVP